MTMTKFDIIHGKILSDIRQGRIKPGQALPPRSQLVKKYSCSPGTIDKIVRSLVKEGMAIGRKGAGVFAREPSMSGKIRRVFIIESNVKSRPFDDGVSADSGCIAAELQRHGLDCSIIHRDELSLNLGKISAVGNAVIWMRPHVSQVFAMFFVRDSGAVQVQIGRNYGGINHITTDAAKGIGEGVNWLADPGDEIFLVSDMDNPDLPFIAERKLAFYQSCLELRIKNDSNLRHTISGLDIAEETRRLADKLFRHGKMRRLIFAMNYSVAYPLVLLADSYGRIPGKDYKMLLFDYEPRLKGRKGIGMLRQKWESMNNAAVQWILGSPSENDEFKIRIEPEFLRD